MQERPQNFDEVGDESEVTLAAPRFDADEARRANPVIPLEEIPAGRARFRAGARRWPLSLIVVTLLAVAALGAVAASVLRRAHTTTPVPASAEATQDQQPSQTDAAPAPAQPVAAPAQSEASATQAVAAQPQDAPAPTNAAEDKTVAAKPVEDKAGGRVEERSEWRAPLPTRSSRAAHMRRDEEVVPSPVGERVARRETDGADGERAEHHGHFKGDDEGRGDRDFRKASKHQNKGGARLVDVLVGRPRP